MQFVGGFRSSIAFDFIYKAYQINIADFCRLDKDGTVIPEEKISVLISKRGTSLSKITMNMISTYINLRICGITSTSPGGVLDVYLNPSDQFMLILMDALNVIVPE